MSKKFTKTILSSAVAGLLLVSGGAMAEIVTHKISDKYYFQLNTENNHASIRDNSNKMVIGPFDVNTGKVTSVNMTEVMAKLKNAPKDPDGSIQSSFNKYQNELVYSIYVPQLSPDNIGRINEKEVESVKSLIEKSKNVITTKNADLYNSIVMNGGSANIALDLISRGDSSQSQIYADTAKKINDINEGKAVGTSFALDREGKITLNERESSGDRESVKNVVAGLVDDTTVSVAEDGSLTMDRSTSNTKRVNEALVDLDKSVKDRTTVGMNSDGSLTTAEGAAKTVAVSEGLVSLSGRTDRIDAAVGAIDGRVTRNTQSIEKNSKAIAANTRTLQQHSARLDSQQRQINENHKEMKRAAAQSAALTGLFQPYSVGKFNATAAVGGYSDEQALAVGVGYRFNEQTAAKAGVAFSDGDASWNVGVNFEF
ncbi:YadA C-terminal domain-containing protein [Escherichia coli]|uniref:YadA C-terminal domain-containing protein n=1 Tax=Escherichia coli TaxID=562 RepID=UPI0023586302|nr:YadA C-terminal domain-containing protein [Escherichia coli]MDC8952606.1 YadA C-terminal domain-containing protein [Escherichia coli]